MLCWVLPPANPNTKKHGPTFLTKLTSQKNQNSSIKLLPLPKVVINKKKSQIEKLNFFKCKSLVNCFILKPAFRGLLKNCNIGSLSVVQWKLSAERLITFLNPHHTEYLCIYCIYSPNPKKHNLSLQICVKLFLKLALKATLSQRQSYIDTVNQASNLLLYFLHYRAHQIIRCTVSDWSIFKPMSYIRPTKP